MKCCRIDSLNIRYIFAMTPFQGSAASVLVSDVLQLVLRGAHDTIPNVRFTAVRALQEMAPHLDAGAVDSQVSGRSCRLVVYTRAKSILLLQSLREKV